LYHHVLSRRSLRAFAHSGRSPHFAGGIGCARGFTLLEVLFVTFVFSVGVLGTVGLQAQAIRHADDARYRAKALQLASALIGRLWSEDPRTMAERYDSSGNGQGYRDFVIEANVLPGTSLAGNAPRIKVDSG